MAVNKVWQGVFALTPVLMTPLLVVVLAEGILDFGGGEKDIILALPWFVWSSIFALSGLALIIKGWNMARWMRRSVVISTAILVGLGIIAYVYSLLGVAASR
ncbi:MAG: hypothetical protein OES09_09490 [Gammaproteobacteria bacterium]|nr:hypothetical protein [Gammaproteobacteria bacterium]